MTIATVSLIPFVAGVQAGRQPASHSARAVVERIVPQQARANDALIETKYRGRSARQWAARFRDRTRELQAARRQAHALRRTLTHTSTVTEAIGLAATAYGQSESFMRQLASCESGLNPRALNPSSSTGLFQILYPSTWRTTPFSRFSPWSAYANAMAAAYMLAHGRRSEWVC